MTQLNSRTAKSFSARQEWERKEREQQERDDMQAQDNPYPFSKDMLDGWRSHPITEYFKGQLIKEAQEALLKFGVLRNDVGAVAMDAAYRDGELTGMARWYRIIEGAEMKLGLKVEDLT